MDVSFCPTMRYAAIDIGTVTCRLLVAEVDQSGLHELAREVAITNLGEGVDSSRVLKAEALARVQTEILRFKSVVDSFVAEEFPEIPLIAMATSASRDAKNSDEFIALLRKTGVELAVISGEQEAALSFLGASSAFPEEKILVLDIGGGSTELIVGTADLGVIRQQSFNVGCRRLTEKFFKNDPPTKAELEEAKAWVHTELCPFVDELHCKNISFDRLIAVAGTATTIVSVDKAMVTYDSKRVHKQEVSRASFDRVYKKLRSVPLEQRKKIIGLEPKRASVIVAGMVILETVLELVEKDCFTVSESDILQGIILDAVAKRHSQKR